jgi:transcriptional regulator GlxA family with amidase domain
VLDALMIVIGVAFLAGAAVEFEEGRHAAGLLMLAILGGVWCLAATTLLDGPAPITVIIRP